MQNKKDKRSRRRGVKKRILITSAGFWDVMKTFVWWFEKVCIHTNTWMAGKNLKRQVYHWKMRFTVISDQWLWLWTCTASLEYHGEKDAGLLSRYLLKNRCSAVGRCIWDLSEYMSKKLQVGSSTFLHHTWISMAGLIKDSCRVLRTWKKA